MNQNWILTTHLKPAKGPVLPLNAKVWLRFITADSTDMGGITLSKTSDCNCSNNTSTHWGENSIRVRQRWRTSAKVVYAPSTIYNHLQTATSLYWSRLTISQCVSGAKDTQVTQMERESNWMVFHRKKWMLRSRTTNFKCIFFFLSYEIPKVLVSTGVLCARTLRGNLRVRTYSLNARSQWEIEHKPIALQLVSPLK